MLMLSSDFDTGMQLLADNELHPNISPDFFDERRTAIASAEADASAGPDDRAADALLQGLFPSLDPMLRLPTQDTIDSLTYADVDAFYQRAFRPDLTTIVVVGDVTPAAARASVERYFGGWSATGPLPPLTLPKIPLNGPQSVVVPAQGHTQDDVALAEIIGVNRSDPDYYALQVANHVLGGGDDATWLFRDVRQDAGLVYSIDSSLAADDNGRSMFSVEYGCDPINVSKAKAIVLRDLHQIQDASLGPDDMRRAKLLLLRRVPLGEQSEDDIADGLLARAVAGQPLDEPTRDAARYLKVTPAQVRAAFAKWIRPDGFVQVVEGPPPQ
jgi:zinc protease